MYKFFLMSLNVKDDHDKVGTSNNNQVPKIVALEVLEKNGVNIDRLKELITKGVGADYNVLLLYHIKNALYLIRW